MKKLSVLLILLILLSGCSASHQPAQVAATTLPVYEFSAIICEGTGIRVTRLVTENVSCLHDYTLMPQQMRAAEGADVLILSGAGLEDFMEDVLHSAATVIDASEQLSLLEGEHHGEHSHGHVHAEDPHIWLSPKNASVMAQNICTGLSLCFPQHEAQFQKNLQSLLKQLDQLQHYGEEKLKDLSCRELVTFHDGFSYLAESFDLTILKAIEEESGSEASAAELIELIGLVREHRPPAIFTEINGSVSAANIVAAETGIEIACLDMAMSGESYFDAMYRNIDTLWEALK